MAKANTRVWERGMFLSKAKCDNCGWEKEEGFTYQYVNRLFYYPTFMNGDAELEKELCDDCYKKLIKK